MIKDVEDNPGANQHTLDELGSRQGRKNNPTVEPDIFRILEDIENAVKLRTLPGPLTAHENHLLKLYLDGYTAKEIADILNVDVRVARLSLNAVRRKVMARLRRWSRRGQSKHRSVSRPPEIEGIYRDGKIELLETPIDIPEDTHVIVTFPDRSYDLQKRGIDEARAADLRARLRTFVEDWESPDMAIYDNYDEVKSKL